MTSQSERLWASSRPSTLTDDERARARRAYDACPAILEGLYRAALGEGAETVESMARVLAEVRK